jgi:hypothetical protein
MMVSRIRISANDCFHPAQEQIMRPLRRTGAILASLLVTVAVASLKAADEGAAPIPDEDLRSTVDARVNEWWPTTDEKRFDEIGWAADLRTALQLAAEYDRPVFLFTMDGRVNTGRC